MRLYSICIIRMSCHKPLACSTNTCWGSFQVNGLRRQAPGMIGNARCPGPLPAICNNHMAV